MKKIPHILFTTIFIYSASINGMEPEISTDIETRKERIEQEELFRFTCTSNMLMISTLLEDGVRLNATNLLRLTIFHSTDHHNEETMPWLLTYREGAEISNCKEVQSIKEAKSTIKNTPSLYQAVHKGDEETVKKLLESDIGSIFLKKNSLSLLFAAIKKDYITIVRLLINGGADINQASEDGNTPLLYAAYKGKFKITELLINSKANVNHNDIQGWTALSAASYKGYVNIVKLLLNNGAHINQTITVDSMVDAAIEKGDTPLLIAQKKGHSVIANLLKNRLEYNMKANNSTQ